MKYLNLDWQKFHRQAFKLYKKINGSEEKFDLIVTISRGGLSLAHVLSDFLDLPVAVITVSTYKDLKKIKKPEIRFKLSENLTNKKILLVDDVSDTGETMIHSHQYLQNQSPKVIKTATLFIKPQTKFNPDFYLESTSSWIIFPYEMKETISILKKKMDKPQLKTIGLDNFFIEQFSK
jgi:hypoxanthine phosphoribosyltransferase